MTSTNHTATRKGATRRGRAGGRAPDRAHPSSKRNGHEHRKQAPARPVTGLRPLKVGAGVAPWASREARPDSLNPRSPVGVASAVLDCVSAPDSPMCRHRSAPQQSPGGGTYAGRDATQGLRQHDPLITLDRVVNSLLRRNHLLQELRTIPGTTTPPRSKRSSSRSSQVKTSDLTDDEIDAEGQGTPGEARPSQALPVIPDRLEYVTTGETTGIWASLSPGSAAPGSASAAARYGRPRGVVILDSGGAGGASAIYSTASGYLNRAVPIIDQLRKLSPGGPSHATPPQRRP
jgi:hypothetical protein